jgi:hypothetical protein
MLVSGTGNGYTSTMTTTKTQAADHLRSVASTITAGPAGKSVLFAIADTDIAIHGKAILACAHELKARGHRITARWEDDTCEALQEMQAQGAGDIELVRAVLLGAADRLCPVA